MVYKLVAGQFKVNISKHQVIDAKMNTEVFLIQLVKTGLIIVVERTYFFHLKNCKIDN